MKKTYLDHKGDAVEFIQIKNGTLVKGKDFEFVKSNINKEDPEFQRLMRVKRNEMMKVMTEK